MTLARLGLLSNESAEADNPAVEVLAALLPRDADIELCLSCRKFWASEPYPFHEATGLFRRCCCGRVRLHASRGPKSWAEQLL